MADINVGSVSVDIVPDTKRFASTLRAKIVPEGDKAGHDLGKTLSDSIAKGIRDGIGKGFEGVGPIGRQKGSQSGKDFGGAFSREAKTRIEAALKSLPEARIGVATSEAEQKLRDLRVEMADLAVKDIGVDLTDTEALAKIDDLRLRLEALNRDSASIQVRADTAAAMAQLAGVQAMVDKLNGENARVDVKSNSSEVAKTAEGLGFMTKSVLTLGPALIPVAAGLVGIGAAFAAPLAAAGAGLTVGAFIAGKAVAQTEKQGKQIDALKKKVDAAKQSLAATETSSAASAAASMASAHRSLASATATATAALGAAKTPAAIASAQSRLAAAQAAYASRSASVQASSHARTAAAQKKVTEAVAAYQAALKGLTPQQAAFLKTQARMKSAFNDLIAGPGGKAVFAPMIAGMDTLSKIMPKLAPVLQGVSRGVGTLLGDVDKFASSKGFDTFMKGFGKESGDAIIAFGRIFENFGKGLFGMFKAFAPLSAMFTDGLTNLSKKFANFGENADHNKGFQAFVAYVQEMAPKVGETIGNLVGAVAHLIPQLAPLGGVVLSAANGLAKFIRNSPPGTLAAIGVSIGGILAAFGKGKFGLAFAISNVLTHSKGFTDFLRTAGTLAGNLATAFSKLPQGIQDAAVAAVGVGVIASKLKGGGIVGGLLGKGTKAVTSALGIASKAKPVPVIVMNKGFGGVPGEGGDPVPVGGGDSWLTKAGKVAGATLNIAVGAITIHKIDTATQHHFASQTGTPQAPKIDPVRTIKNIGVANVFGGVMKHLVIPGIGGPGGPAHAAADDLKNVDTTLANLVKSGHLQAAADQFAALRREAQKEHVSLDDLKNAFPQYIAQVDAARAAVKKYGDMLHGLPKHIKITFEQNLVRHHNFGADVASPGAPNRTPQFRANGGPVYAGQPYIVGERRPELFIPERNGRIDPNPQAKSGGLTIEQQHLYGVDIWEWKRDQEHMRRASALGGADFT